MLKKLNFSKFQNFHLWIKIFKNRNRPIPAGKSHLGFIFWFFDVKTLLYIKKVNADMFWWLYTIIYCENTFFGKPTNDFFPLHVCRMVLKNFEISAIEKYDVSAFQRTFERPSTTSRSKFIPFWNSKIPLSLSFPRMHHMELMLQNPIAKFKPQAI